jgi:hypothetical protein
MRCPLCFLLNVSEKIPGDEEKAAAPMHRIVISQRGEQLKDRIREGE